MKLFIKTLLLASVPFSTLLSQPINENDNAALENKMESMWNYVRGNFYSPATGLFYTVAPEKLPTPSDISELKPLKKNGVPNWHGGMSGMEDSSMFGGIILAGLCDRFLVLGDDASRERAREAFRGLKTAATAHGDKGFVARGVSPADGKSIYPGSSRDQFTHSIHGMWRYYNSGMSSDEEKGEIRSILSDIADKMAREVRADAVPPYSFKFYRGMADDRGVGKMLEVYPHEAARLSMFYAAAYDVTKNQKYFNLYKKHLPYALSRTAELMKMTDKQLRSLVPAYSILQMQASLEVLYALEKDGALKKRIAELMDSLSEYVEKNPVFNLDKKGMRDCAEVINGQLLAPNYKLSKKHENILRLRIAKGGAWAGGVYTMVGAYWRARLKGYLKP